LAPSRFDIDTACTPVKTDGATRIFETRVDPGWWISRGPNGGYVAALLMQALTAATADPERSARSLTVHFTAPPAEGPALIEVRIERTGRSLTSLSARMTQGDRLCALALAAFSRPRVSEERLDAQMPEVPPADRCEPLEPEGAATLRARYEQRRVATGPEQSGGWMRLADARVANAAVIAAFSDSWPPVLFDRRAQRGDERRVGAPTVDLSIHFRSSLPLPDADPADFYLTLFTCRVIREGFLEEDGEIWSASGELIAQSRQLGALL